MVMTMWLDHVAHSTRPWVSLHHFSLSLSIITLFDFGFAYGSCHCIKRSSFTPIITIP